MVYRSFTKSKLSLVIIASMALFACGGTGTKTSQVEQPAPNLAASQNIVEEAALIAKPGLKPRERLSRAIVELGKGASDLALVELEAYLLEVPNSVRASKLIEQIKTDSVDYFPSQFFTVELTSGQSLSTLAKHYLGTTWEFYALAKYNGIANPSRVNVGSIIKIPLTELAQNTLKTQEMAASNAPMPDDFSQDEMTSEASVDEESELQGTPDLEGEAELDIEEIIAEGNLSQDLIEIQEVPVVSSESLSQQLLNANVKWDYESAVSFVDSLQTFGALSPESSAQALVAFEGQALNIKDKDPSAAANLYLRASQIYIDKGDQIAAFMALKLASETGTASNQTREQMLSMQKDITQKYHREASAAFRQQALSEAIEKWDVVLAVDPKHSNALAYRMQAIELKQKLEALKQD